MRLNPTKCVFGVASGKFLGFMVFQRGIEANPKKVQAIINMASPKTVKEVQKLTGRIAALNRFVFRATDKCLPFFKTLKQAFAWIDERETAFQELKHYLSNPPLLSPSKQGESLYLYLAISETAVSAALIREEGRKQLPVYYVSQAFQRAEFRYPRIEKIMFALIVASRKLRQYFQANPIQVMIDQPIKKSMKQPEAAGRMIQWAIELSQFDIEYHPRTAIKAQVLADFIAKFTSLDEDRLINEAGRWTIQTDGSSAQKRGGVGVVIITHDGKILKYGVRLKFPATSNEVEAEYEGILTGLRLGRALGATNLLVQNDSKLVIGQIKGDYEAKEERMQKYVRLMKHLTREFDRVEFTQIPKIQNTIADEVSKLASSEEEGISMNLEMEVQKYPNIEEMQTFVIQRANSWMTPIVAFLQDGHLPENTKEAKKVKKKAVRFTILKKRGFSMPYLKCVDKEKAQYILAEIHQGIYGDHAGPKSLVNKAIRISYFWPTMQVDAIELVKKCDRCQRYGNVQRLPAERLTAISSPWPFAQWGNDIVDPLPQGKGQVKFLLVAIDYFTKWVEAEALAMITEVRIQSFFWKNIIVGLGFH